MCGIVSFIGDRPAAEVLVEGLTRLEYRGYDSAGIALLEHGEFDVIRSVGKLKNLKEKLSGKAYMAPMGIGHTRWATHGKPSYENAHPHKSDAVTVVHNGIIENYLELKQGLLQKGYVFSSETDTEVIAHLIDDCMKSGSDTLFSAVRCALKQLRGAYAIAVIARDNPDEIVLARMESPLVIGVGNGENFGASDIPAVLHYTRDFMFLNDGDIALLTRSSVQVFDIEGNSVDRPVKHIDWNPVMAEKSGYKHFMLKEIYEQPRAIIDTIRGKYSLDSGEVQFGELSNLEGTLQNIDRIVIVACGTSWHAGLIGKFYIERIAKVPVEVDIASEFRYRDLLVNERVLFLTITQSGETLDTLTAMRMAQKHGAKAIAICNVVGSTASRDADGVIYTHAGPEIGVASTKAFTTQVVSLYLFALFLGQKRGAISADDSRNALLELVALPEKIEQTLKLDTQIEEIAKQFKDYSDFLYLGRNMNYPIALEGALKLKEISYIHAEGYPAGEMKHGPIALIDAQMPVFVLATKSFVSEKVVSNVEEVKARDGIVIATVTEGSNELDGKADHIIAVPDSSEELSVFTNAVVTQLFSYHVASLLGLDVDQPRNLAKSVTVE